MGTTHGAGGLRQAPAARQGQPSGGVSQRHFDQHAMPFALTQLQGLQHGLAGHQCAAHVGKQGGRQFQPGHKVVFRLVGEVMAGFLGPLAGRADDGDLAKLRVGLVQSPPVQPELGQGRRTERCQQHIGLSQLALHPLLAGGLLEISAEHTDALVHLGVRLVSVVLHRITLGRLYFDAACAHGLAAQQGGGARQVQAEAENAAALQGEKFAHFLT